MAPQARQDFETTRWSLVLATGADEPAVARQALADLCQAYWYPLYAVIRRRGHSAEDAQDLIQAFFVLLLERGEFAALRPERGRFRAFLLVALRHFLENQRQHAQALKRGGGQRLVALDVPRGEDRYLVDGLGGETPEAIFDRTWALALLDEVFRRLRSEWAARGKVDLFERLKGCLMGEAPPGGYQALAATFRTTEAAVKMAAHRLKDQFRRHLREAIAETVTGDLIEDEIRHLIRAVRG
jgi:DNA-directed RNA polymerase specialized sigma24 family protein